MKYPLSEGTPDALVIHCADPRFQEAFRAFLKNELGISMPMVIALPGVTSHFGMQMMFPKNWYAMRSHLKTMTDRHDVARVVLINHDDCKGYAKVADKLGGLVKVPDWQRKHLHGLAEFIRNEYLPHASFELYQAHIVGETDTREVNFERIL